MGTGTARSPGGGSASRPPPRVSVNLVHTVYVQRRPSTTAVDRRSSPFLGVTSGRTDKNLCRPGRPLHLPLFTCLQTRGGACSPRASNLTSATMVTYLPRPPLLCRRASPLLTYLLPWVGRRAWQTSDAIPPYQLPPPLPPPWQTAPLHPPPTLYPPQVRV